VREAEIEDRIDSVGTGDGITSSILTTLVQQIQANENGSIEDYMTVYLGTEDQTPDPTLEEIYGVGNVPAYRGQAYVVFNRLPLELFERGAQVPQLRFEVCRELDEVPAAPADDDNTGDDVL